MTHQMFEHHFDTVVVGGGQAGLAIGYFLTQQDRDFVILDAGSRGGDVWRCVGIRYELSGMPEGMAASASS